MDGLRKQFNDKWQRLCEEFETTRDVFFKAASVVEHRLATTGGSTQEELDALNSADSRFADVRRRMDAATQE